MSMECEVMEITCLEIKENTYLSKIMIKSRKARNEGQIHLELGANDDDKQVSQRI